VARLIFFKEKRVYFMKNSKGFTLIEILISTLIMAVVLAGTFQTASYLLQVNELNDYQVICMNFLEGKMNEIRGVGFDNVLPQYSNVTFLVPELTAKGVQHLGLVTISTLETFSSGLPSMLGVKIIICLKQKNRILGEDANFNGLLDTGEDTLNVNGGLDSPYQIEVAVNAV